MGSNCVPCIEYHIPQARKAGINDSEIAEAIRLSDRVRQVPARKVLEVAVQMVAPTSGTAEIVQSAPPESEKAATDKLSPSTDVTETRGTAPTSGAIKRCCS
jgi:4-carboxymuconolactone decarboxylase